MAYRMKHRKMLVDRVNIDNSINSFLQKKILVDRIDLNNNILTDLKALCQSDNQAIN